MKKNELFTANDLIVLSDILEAGSFAEAARRMGISRATLSLRVKKMEQQIGVQLFRRNTHSLIPTEHGDKLCQQGGIIKHTMKKATETIHKDANVLSGSVHICAPVGFGTEILKYWIFEFADLYPRVKVRITMENGVDDLVSRNIDVSVRVATHPAEDVIAKQIGTLKYGLFGSVKSVEKYGNSPSFDNISELPLLVSDFVGRKGVVVARRGNEKKIVDINPRLVTSNFLLMREAAAHGIGWTFLPEYLATSSGFDRILMNALPEWQFDAYGEHLYVVRLSERHQSPVVKILVDFICRKAMEDKWLSFGS